jgi:tellurite resistance protein TerC
MIASAWLWIGFALFILAMLALDLGVFHRKPRAVSFKEALGWTAIWVTLALLFGAGVRHFAGEQKALEFYTGWLIEYSLSVDNVFVFALIFSYFAVPPAWQHKVLFWGILGALVMRLVMISAGAALITRFSWLLYLFGAFLLFTGIRMAFRRMEQIRPERNPIVRSLRKCVPMTRDYQRDRFAVHQNGRWLATPLLVVLVCVETTDLMFATDSIPAIFAVTLDPFILYSSNVFAILGLRSLYFVLAGAMNLFHYLKLGLGMVLVLMGVKMLLAHTAWEIGTLPALLAVATVLALCIVASLIPSLAKIGIIWRKAKSCPGNWILRNGRRVRDDGSEAGIFTPADESNAGKDSRGKKRRNRGRLRNQRPASDFEIVGSAAEAHGRIVGRGALIAMSSPVRPRDPVAKT